LGKVLSRNSHTIPLVDYVMCFEKVLFVASGRVMHDDFEKDFTDKRLGIVRNILELCWLNYEVNTEFFKQVVKTRMLLDDNFLRKIDPGQRKVLGDLCDRNNDFFTAMNI
jgi:hypothetical protein